jgi:hypothetical protein
MSGSPDEPEHPFPASDSVSVGTGGPDTEADDRAGDRADDGEVLPAGDDPGGARRGRRIDKSRLILSMLAAVGVALILFGVLGSVTGRTQSSLPDEIERITPSLGDKVLNQTNVLADFIAGYGARMEIDGLAIPQYTTFQEEPGGESTDVTAPPPTIADPTAARFDLGTNTLSFQPRPGAVIERFEVGRHFVKVFYWKLAEGEATALSYTWYFDVSA